MIKKCIGCGCTLQNTDKEKKGYTPSLDKTYCMRCFRLKNYGELKEEKIEEEKIIKKVNQKKGIAFFFVDFFNIHENAISLYNQISIPKVLVISKSDTLRKDMKEKKLEKYIREVYHIKEDIYFISNKKESFNILKYLENHHENTAFIMGLTNAGKSTYINSLLKKEHIEKEIVVSKHKNTTLDFIKMHVRNFIIYDTPGFSYLGMNNELLNKEIKPITYQIKESTFFLINKNIWLYLEKNNSVTFYLNAKIERKKETKEVLEDVFINKNSDIMIPGLGFINIKNQTNIKTNIKDLEIRPDYSEVNL